MSVRYPPPAPPPPPPRVPAWLLRHYFAGRRQPEVGGDLTELFEARQRSSGRLNAAVWFWSQLVSFPLYRLRERFHGIRAPSSGRPGGTQPRKRGSGIGAFSRDLRYAVRRLRQSPGFTVIAVTIMGLGIGANTAIFSIVNAVLFRPLPYERPAELVRVYTADEGDSAAEMVAYPDFLDIRERSDLFSGAAAHTAMFLNLVGDDGSEAIFAEYVSASFFDVLEMPLTMGRSFEAEEDQPGVSEAVAVVGYRAWVRRYGGDPNIIGKTVRLNGHPVTIVGVGPKDFSGTMVGVTMEFWLPMGTVALLDPDERRRLGSRRSRGLAVTARLRPNVTVARATAALEAFGRQLAEQHPETNTGRTIVTMRASDVRLHPLIDAALYPVAGLLMAVVGLVLLVACTNLANLLLVRASSRSREVAVRLALGASRRRLVSQLLTESLLLAGLGGLLGLALAYWTANLIARFRPPLPVTITVDIAPDGTVLLFTVVLSIATGVIFGLVPSLRASRPDLVTTLKDETRSAVRSRRRHGLTSGLVVAQVAVSFVLLIAAGLFLRGLGNAQRVDPGFETTNAAIATVAVGLGGYSVEEGREFVYELVRRIEAQPGVRGVAVADRVPLGASVHTEDIVLDDPDAAAGRDTLVADFMVVGPKYFEVMNVPILRGRAFTSHEGNGAPSVAIVNRAMARQFWGTDDVVGRRFSMDETQAVIVGVARDTKVRTLGEAPRPQFYLSFEQNAPSFLFVSLIVATVGDPAAMPDALRREVQALNPDVPLFEAKTMQEHLGLMLFVPRMAAMLLSAFGLLAMALAAIGLYGVVGFSVAQRTREVGIRVALGADRSNVVGMVIREGMLMVIVGLLVGLGLSLVAMRPIAGLLHGVPPTDLVTFGGVALGLGAVALLATYVPARRAARIDPMIALRYE